MTCSTTLGTEGGVGDAAWLRVLPWTKNPTETNRHILSSVVLKLSIMDYLLNSHSSSYSHHQ